jgi:hypothetical protein
MNSMEEIFNLWREMLERYPQYRVGQALFNAVSTLDVELANRMREAGIDPFYLDDRVGAAIEWLYKGLGVR